MSDLCLATSQILDLFAEEIGLRSGKVTDTFDDGRRLFTRATLPRIKYVRPEDRLRGGVALKATSKEICVHPYVFREVCSNGAIMAHSLQTRRIVSADDATQEEVALEICEAVGACCRDEVFAESMDEIVSAISIKVDVALTMLPLLSRLSAKFGSLILEQFFGSEDSSQYGLMNVITAAARDTSDPEERWRLEELGGGVAAKIIRRPPTDQDAVPVHRRDPVEIG